MGGVPTVSRTVVVFAYRLSKERIAQVAVACDRVKANMLLSNGVLPDAAKPGEVVLVAGLNAGERRIPEELLRLLRTERSLGALLLISDEPLVRASVSLYRGRLVILGSDATTQTITSQLRIVLAERATAIGAPDAGERAYPHWWSGDLTTAPGSSQQFLEDHGGFTHVFALQGAIGLSVDELANIREALASQSECPGQFPQQSANAGTTIGAIHYDPQSQRIRIVWPPSPRTLWMVSPVRLPVLSELSSSAKCASTMRASVGDILLALSRAGSAIAASAVVRDLSTHAQFGGPAVHDAVSAMLTPGTEVWATVTEIR